MDDDFNTALALGYYFEMSHVINAYLAAADKHDQSDVKNIAVARQLFYLLGDIMGIYLEGKPQKNDMIDRLLDIFAQERKVARQNKNYALADNLRDFLRDTKIQVEDLEGGVRFRYEEAPDPKVLVDFLSNIAANEESGGYGEAAARIYNSLEQVGFSVEKGKE